MAKIKLVVTQPFGDRNVGDEITDPAEVEATRESHPHFVVAVEVVEDAEAGAPAVAEPTAPAKSAGKA